MRLFFAIELPNDVQSVLGRLNSTADDPDYRWVDPSLLHLTLAFLGEQPPEKLEVLHQVGAAAASASQPGVLRLGEAGSFGTRRTPRVLWVDIAGDVNAMLRLQGRLDTELREAGFSLEDRPFRPHITLARRREAARGGPPVGWPPNVKPATFALSILTLMQSRLSPRGPTYTPVEHFAIGG